MLLKVISLFYSLSKFFKTYIFLILQDRKTSHLPGLGYGHIGMKFILRIFEKEIDRRGKSVQSSKTERRMDAVRRLLGQSSVTATKAYLGISDERH